MPVTGIGSIVDCGRGFGNGVECVTESTIYGISG
jgi:hypothetical protein